MELTLTAVVSDTAAFTPTATNTPQPTGTPQPEMYLETADGLRLAAGDTVLVAQRQLDGGPEGGHRLVAVLAGSNAGIRSGVDRLLSGDFSGCMTSADLAVCSGPSGGSSNGASNGSTPSLPGAGETAIPTPPLPIPVPITPIAPATPVPGPGGDKTAVVLVVDDNDVIADGEVSEADIYLQVLIQEGLGPTLWTTAENGVPALADLEGYKWVIWSSGGYESGGPSLGDLDALLAYISGGGNLTISSRRPFFGMSAEDPAVIADVAVEADLPELVQGLPSEPFALGNGLPPVTPLEIGADNQDARVALRRGPDSGGAGAPLLFLVTDDEGPDATGARLLIMGMALSWLPDDYDEQLVRNMSGLMLEE